MRQHDPGRATVLAEALEWIRVLPSADFAQRLEFVQWVKASPEHLKQFLLLTAFETEAAGLRSASEFDLDSLIASLPPVPRLRSVTRSVPNATLSPPLVHSAHKRSAPTTRRAIAAAIVVGVLATCLWAWLSSNLNNAAYATSIGERRSYVLPDGSRLQLNTESRVRVHFMRDRRRITLVAGEARFQVAPDPGRAFEVDVGLVRVLDLGTIFTIRADPHRASVYVIDGRVSLSTLQNPAHWASEANSAPKMPAVKLAPGEESEIGMNGTGVPEISFPRKLTPEEAESRVAWTRGLLYLVDAPLTEVVREINRYHLRKIVIADPALERFKLGGTIDPTTNDYAVIVRILSNSCRIDVDQSQASVVTIRRANTTERCSRP